MMGDIYCAVCGEPWDAYGVYHGDMTEEEKENFLAGRGCPVCKGRKPRDINNLVKFLLSVTDGTDEDPVDILTNVDFGEWEDGGSL